MVLRRTIYLWLSLGFLPCHAVTTDAKSICNSVSKSLAAPNRVESPRMYFRPLRIDEFVRFYEMMTNPIAYQHQYPGRAEYTLEAAHDNFLKMMESNSGYVMVDRETDTIIGDFRFEVDPTRRTASIGYIVKPEFWGRGYATEAVRAFVEYAKMQGVESIGAYVSEHNKASMRCLEKNGFTIVDTVRGFGPDRNKAIGFVYKLNIAR